MSRRSKRYVQSVSDLSDGALRCHAFGHPWNIGPVSRLSPVGLEVWTVKLDCPSCGKVRTDQVEPGTYELYYRHYTSPPRYSVVDPADRHDFRAEVIRRAEDGRSRRFKLVEP